MKYLLQTTDSAEIYEHIPRDRERREGIRVYINTTACQKKPGETRSICSLDDITGHRAFAVVGPTFWNSLMNCELTLVIGLN